MDGIMQSFVCMCSMCCIGFIIIFASTPGSGRQSTAKRSKAKLSKAVQGGAVFSNQGLFQEIAFLATSNVKSATTKVETSKQIKSA